MQRPDFHPLRLTRGAFFRFAVGLLLAGPLNAQTYTFTKIADTQTAVPGGTGNFTNLIEAFSGEGMVGFYAASGGSARGVYLAEIAGDGTVTHARMADYSTPAPGGSQNFSDFQLGRGGILNGVAYFHGSYNDASGTWSGIHAYDSDTGTLSRVIGRGSSFPVLGGSTTQVGYVLSRGGNLTISTNRQSGLNNYGGFVRTTDGSVFTAPVDGSATGGTPNSIGPYATNGSRIVVRSSGTFHSFDAGGVQATRDFTTVQVPNQAFNFGANLPAMALTANELFFTSNTSGVQGLYRINADLTGPVSLVADISTGFPGYAGNLSFFGALSANSDSVAFIANSGSSARGIFLYHAGQVSTIIDSLSPLDGLTISNFTMTEAGLSDDGLAFRVAFTNGANAIYYTRLSAVPEPATWAALLGGIALGLVGIQRKRQRTR